MKKFKKFLDQELMTLEDVNASYQSWRGYLKRKDNYKTLCSLDKLYYDLFADNLYLYAIAHLFD